MKRLVIFAPNWLGDAVMALPAIEDVRRAWGDAEIAVAARPAIAPLFSLVPAVSQTIVLNTTARGFGILRAMREDAAHVRAFIGSAPGGPALLLPNSFRAALVAAASGAAERWGYRTDLRRSLLTRAIARPARPVHQAEYYQQLTAALGFPAGPMTPHISVPTEARAAAATLLGEAGWNGDAPLVALAPGAAYGGAKRWLPERYADVAAQIGVDGAVAVMVGSGADVATGREVKTALAARAPMIDLMGRTDLLQLAGVLACCRAMVSNDSGAMHLAAAVGVPVVAVFGPTNDAQTSPLPSSATARRHRVVFEPVHCRPCMLRECPIDHRCMHRISAAVVTAAVREMM